MPHSRPPAPAKAESAHRPIHLPWQKTADGEALRDTGIALIGKIPWGTHMCLFCETKRDVLEAASEYFAAARDAREQCVWVVSQPLTVAEAVAQLRATLPEFEERHRAGLFDVVTDEEWYFVDGRFDWHKTLAQWQAVIAKALARGLEGVRVFGNPWWRRIGEWRDMQEFEAMLEKTVAAWPMIMLCSYMTEKSDPVDVFDVASAHQCAIARRHGVWEFLEAPHNDDARRELDLLNGDLEIVPERIRGLLTERERVVLAQLVRGHSSKEVARSLGISPRTVDFHRANLMQKLGARNAAELIAKAVTGS